MKKIYIYTTEENKKKGYLKIGETTRDVETRVAEQVSNIKMPIKNHEILYQVDAKYEFNNEFFSDKIVHKGLLERGYKRYENSEWFKCTLDEIIHCINEIKHGKKIDKKRNVFYQLRPEQKEAIIKTKKYFENTNNKNNLHFLWNAKMRFGKTYTSYKLMQEMNWKNVLIMTHKPAVEDSWKNDLNNHIDFEGFNFYGSKEISEGIININIEEKNVFFVSFQDFLGMEGNKEKFNLLYKINFDCIFLDEYHFGSWNENSKKVYKNNIDFEEELEELEELDNVIKEIENKKLNIKNYLYLSGTPYRSIYNGEFSEEQIFNWTYSDEQAAKNNWKEENNPYLELPTMSFYIYKISNTLRKEIEKKDEESEFNLNSAFKAKYKEYIEESEFINKKFVIEWLDSMILGNSSYKHDADEGRPKNKPIIPFKDMKEKIKHTLWYMPNISSCFAMRNLLKENEFFKDYKIIVAAGNKFGNGVDALFNFKKELNNLNDEKTTETKSITLTCGKLTTGVSVPEWTGIFMLRNLSSMEAYFQSAFRVQTPWYEINKINNEKKIYKEECFVFEFDLNRSLNLIFNHAISKKNKELKNDKDYNEDLKNKIEETIEYLNIYAHDGFETEKLDANKIFEISISGTTSKILASRFNTLSLININDVTLNSLLENSDLLKELSKIEGFRNLKQDIKKIITKEEIVNKNQEKSSKKENIKIQEEIKQINQEKKKIQETLLKLINRLPVFMYLTDYREKSVIDLIRNIETNLFIKTTGISIESFEKLYKLNIFDDRKLNLAILSFKKYEENSFDYMEVLENKNEEYGAWNTVISKDDYNIIFENK